MTKEELRKEYENLVKRNSYQRLTTDSYSEWLEQKLIDQEPKQREVSEDVELILNQSYTFIKQLEDNAFRNNANRDVVDYYGDFAGKIKKVLDNLSMKEPKQTKVSEEINIFEDSTYTIQFRDNLTSRGTSDFKIKGSELLKLMLPIEREQTEVSEKEFIPSDAFADELSVWKEKDYALKIKLREKVEFAEWCVINANPNFPNKGIWYYKGVKYTPKELYDLFKSKTK